MQTLSDFQNSGLSIADLAQHVDDLATAIVELKSAIANDRYDSDNVVLSLMIEAHANGHKHLASLLGV